MKTTVITTLSVVALLVLLAIALLQSREQVNLAKFSRVVEETSLHLPEGTKIVATAAHTLSLADGNNFEWLIESDRPLTEWIESSLMHREDGDGLSWAHVKKFGEVAEIARDEDRNLPFDSVWMHKNGNKTSYLYLASGRRVALLTTFNP